LPEEGLDDVSLGRSLKGPSRVVAARRQCLSVSSASGEAIGLRRDPVCQASCAGAAALLSDHLPIDVSHRDFVCVELEAQEFVRQDL